jgi:hypothetical protein
MQAARHLRPLVHGDIYWHSTFELVCLGLNAPVEKPAILIYSLLGSWAGVFSSDLIYVVLTAMLWYVVGSKLDSYRYPKAGEQEGFSVGRVLRNILGVLYGLYLLLFICFHNVIFTNPPNGTGGSSNHHGDLIRQSLWFMWSLVFILIPGRTLVGAISSKLRRPTSTG